jgi:hypothetical protein
VTSTMKCLTRRGASVLGVVVVVVVLVVVAAVK